MIFCIPKSQNKRYVVNKEDTESTYVQQSYVCSDTGGLDTKPYDWSIKEIEPVLSPRLNFDWFGFGSRTPTVIFLVGREAVFRGHQRPT